jgi:two-component system cell cycle sensor histidine kinase/response regulator CckA
MKKKAKKKRKEASEKLTGKRRSVLDAIVLLDEDGKIAFWNRAAEQLFGYTEDEVLGRSFTMLIPKGSADAHMGMLSLWGDPDYEQYRDRTIVGSALHSGGLEFPVVLSLSRWNLKGDRYICVIVRHVGDDEADRRIWMQERMAAVGSIAAGVAHDFNNALLPIILYSEILLNEGSMDPSTAELLEIIRNQAQHAASLTQQIMDFSKQNHAEMLPLDMAFCLKEFMKLLDRTFPENIRLDVDYGLDSCHIKGDENKMQQALLNLAINARDAMPSGGELRIRLSGLHLEAEDPPPFVGMPPGNWVRLDVTDTGVGIPAENLPSIFNPFFTTKDKEGGHGLGLVQVYSIVKQHQGFIDVVSRYRKGTTFTIYIPALIESQVVEAKTVKDVPILGNQEKILVVEDDDVTRKAICEALKYMNYRVWETDRGQDAIDIYKREKVDLVICDLVMPEMSGSELFEELRKLDGDAKMIILSGYPLEESGDEMVKRGIAGSIQKPADIRTVSLAVGRVLQGDSLQE